MTIKNILIVSLFVLINNSVFGQKEIAKLNVVVSVDDNLKETFKEAGRLVIYFTTENEIEPRNSSTSNGKGFVFSKDIDKWYQRETKYFIGTEDWTKSASWTFASAPHGIYNIQMVWVQNEGSKSIANSPGNLYSKSIKINTKETKDVKLVLSKIIQEKAKVATEITLVENELVKLFTFKSEVLSEWNNTPTTVKASILLPSGYLINPDKNYPVRYNIAEHEDSYTRVNELVNDVDFMSWWRSERAPQVITIFLDKIVPSPHSYKLDANNISPYGKMLVEEFIPKIEHQFRATDTAESRYIDGGSSSGWISLAIKQIYPETFGG